MVVHHVPEEELAYPACFANLIVSEEILASDRLPYRPSAVLRLLQPYGGTIALRSPDGAASLADWQLDELSDWTPTIAETDGSWQVAQRGQLPGAGQWTQMYADPANTVCSGDRLVGSDFAMQWFGPPGAEDVVERHAVAMPPLFKDGKLFVAGLFNTVQCVDAYNGTRLWKTTVPESTRMMLSHNAGFMAAGDGVLFVAADSDCWMLDADTGELLHKFSPVNSESDWGYVGVSETICWAPTRKRPPTSTAPGREEEGYRFLTSARDLHSRPTVSETLFAFDYRTRSAFGRMKALRRFSIRRSRLGPTACISSKAAPRKCWPTRRGPRGSRTSLPRVRGWWPSIWRTAAKSGAKPLGPLSDVAGRQARAHRVSELLRRDAARHADRAHRSETELPPRRAGRDNGQHASGSKRFPRGTASTPRSLTARTASSRIPVSWTAKSFCSPTSPTH